MTTTTFVANTFEIIGFSSITKFLKNLVVEMQRRKNIRETIKELNKLSTYELNDIGIARGDIWHIANSSYPKAGEKIDANLNLRGWV